MVREGGRLEALPSTMACYIIPYILIFYVWLIKSDRGFVDHSCFLDKMCYFVYMIVWCRRLCFLCISRRSLQTATCTPIITV